MSTAARRPTALPTSLTRILARGWRWILALMLLGVVLGAAAGALRAPAYEATASVAVPVPVESDAIGLAVSDDPAQRVEAAADRLRSTEVLADALERTGTSLTAAELRGRLDARNSEGSDVLDVTASAPTADEAVALADGAAASLVAAIRADVAARADTVRTELEALQEIYRDRIAQAEEELAAADPEADATTLATQRDLATSELHETQATAERLRVDAALVASSAAELQPADAPTGPATAGPALAGAVGGLLGLVLGVLLAWWVVERRPLVETPDDPAELLGLELLGSVRADDTGGLQPGAREAVDAMSFHPAFAACDLLLCAPVGAGRHSAEAALQLALALSEGGDRIALCDADPGDPHLARRLRPELLAPGLDGPRARVEASPGREHRVRFAGVELTYVPLAPGGVDGDETVLAIDALIAEGHRVVLHGPPITAGRQAATLMRLADAAVLTVARDTPATALQTAHHRLVVSERPLLGYVWLAGTAYQAPRATTARRQSRPAMAVQRTS